VKGREKEEEEEKMGGGEDGRRREEEKGRRRREDDDCSAASSSHCLPAILIAHRVPIVANRPIKSRHHLCRNIEIRSTEAKEVRESSIYSKMRKYKAKEKQ